MQEKYVKYQNFPTSFSGMFWRNFTKIRQFFTQRGHIPLRNECEILAAVHKTRSIEHSKTHQKISYNNLRKIYQLDK